MNCGSEDPGTAKRVRHRVLVSKKGEAAARRRIEPGKCVVGRAHEACLRKWCNAEARDLAQRQSGGSSVLTLGGVR